MCLNRIGYDKKGHIPDGFLKLNICTIKNKTLNYYFFTDAISAYFFYSKGLLLPPFYLTKYKDR